MFILGGSFFCLHDDDCAVDLFKLFACVFDSGEICGVVESEVPLVVGGSGCGLCGEVLQGILCEFLDGEFVFGSLLF